MTDKVYYNGKLIPAKDWDYNKKKPKVKKKEPVEVSVELPQEVQPVTEE